MTINQINPELRAYIEASIITQYLNFDGAHQPDHVHQVIANSFDIASGYEVNLDMVYAVAAFHDIGLKYGREGHEAAAKQIVLEDTFLASFFTPEQRMVIAEAAQDHRASSKHEPRSIYGKIISEADRDINFERILARTIRYRLDHFPTFDRETTYHDAYNHLVEKYGPDSGMTFWLDYEKNLKNIQVLYKALADETVFKAAFDKLYDEQIEH